MFCKFCGRNIIDESEFCPYCGKRAEKSCDFGSAAPFPYKNSAVKPNPQKKLIILISLSCAAVALAAILVAVILLCARSPKGSGAVVLPSISGSTATQTATAPTTTTTTTAPTTTTTKAATTAKPTTAKPTAAYDMARVREVVKACEEYENNFCVCTGNPNASEQFTNEAYDSLKASGRRTTCMGIHELGCCRTISEAEKHFHRYYFSSIEMDTEWLYEYKGRLFVCLAAMGGFIYKIDSVEACEDGTLNVRVYEYYHEYTDMEKKTLVLKKENGIYKLYSKKEAW